jgi:restriction system protein
MDTIPRLCKSKKDVLFFFSSAGVKKVLLKDLSDRLQKDANSINKYEIARTVLVMINDAGDVTLRERREIVKRIVEFNDFSRCWPDDQMEAAGLVAKVREMVNVRDHFTRLQQNHESLIEEEKKKRQREEEARLEQLRQKRQKRQAIKSELVTLYQESDTKKRGKQLEEILNGFFESEGVLVREAFTIKGENNEGIIQQIDGAIEVNSYPYLVEMKWWKEALH